jgi:hypothetical protein
MKIKRFARGATASHKKKMIPFSVHHLMIKRADEKEHYALEAQREKKVETVQLDKIPHLINYSVMK